MPSCVQLCLALAACTHALAREEPEGLSLQQCAAAVRNRRLQALPGIAVAYRSPELHLNWGAIVDQPTIRRRLNEFGLQLRAFVPALVRESALFVWSDSGAEVLSNPNDGRQFSPIAKVTWGIGNTSCADAEEEVNPSVTRRFSSAAMGFVADPMGLGSHVFSQSVSAVKELASIAVPDEITDAIRRPQGRLSINPFNSVHVAFILPDGLDKTSRALMIECSVNCELFVA